ncbi:conserved hypothetical protein [Ricinus communis]|uniref:Uncharacterized protein n=1 Tax=Ricinus communis TaxID=3988 RepID=B9S336_RICCO|nr:conserved hypothetical protein [Ricinus communis]
MAAQLEQLTQTLNTQRIEIDSGDGSVNRGPCEPRNFNGTNRTENRQEDIAVEVEIHNPLDLSRVLHDSTSGESQLKKVQRNHFEEGKGTDSYTKGGRYSKFSLYPMTYTN